MWYAREKPWAEIQLIWTYRWLKYTKFVLQWFYLNKIKSILLGRNLTISICPVRLPDFLVDLSQNVARHLPLNMPLHWVLVPPALSGTMYGRSKSGQIFTASRTVLCLLSVSVKTGDWKCHWPPTSQLVEVNSIKIWEPIELLLQFSRNEMRVEVWNFSLLPSSPTTLGLPHSIYDTSSFDQSPERKERG